MEMSCQLHAPNNFVDKQFSIPIRLLSEWFPKPVWMLFRNENSLARYENRVLFSWLSSLGQSQYRLSFRYSLYSYWYKWSTSPFGDQFTIQIAVTWLPIGSPSISSSLWSLNAGFLFLLSLDSSVHFSIHQRLILYSRITLSYESDPHPGGLSIKFLYLYLPHARYILRSSDPIWFYQPPVWWRVWILNLRIVLIHIRYYYYYFIL